MDDELLPLKDDAARIRVNELQCLLFAKCVPSLVSLRAFQDHFALRDRSPAEQVHALIHLVGICDRVNWDVLLNDMARPLWEGSSGFQYDQLVQRQWQWIREAFGDYKRTDGAVGYQPRLQNLCEIARFCEQNSLSQQLVSCSTVRDALQLLRPCPVYDADPLMKKCNALLHELVRRKLLVLTDADSLEPAVDYHLQRLYLRTARVMVEDAEIMDRLIRRTQVRIELLTAIRSRVAEAIKCTARIAKVSVSTLNDVEWAFARKACRRDVVACGEPENCLLATWCWSAGLDPNKMVTEPRSSHGHY